MLDGQDAPISDGLIETWQLGPPGTRGFARAATDAEGRWAILTLKPPAVRGPKLDGDSDDDGAVHAPHLAVSVFARGLLKRALTRVDFDDEPAANAADPTLNAIADDAARATLIAARGPRGYHFDIHMQGARATVFFDG